MTLALPHKQAFAHSVPRTVIEHSLAQRALLAQKRKGAPSAPRKILIVDDEPSMRLLLRRTLELGFYTVYEAANGTAALRMIEQIDPDVILLDINLPDMNGLDILKEIRKSDFTVGVLMVSALNHRQWVELAQAEGADGFIGKPYMIKDILNAVTRLVEQVNTRRAQSLRAEL